LVPTTFQCACLPWRCSSIRSTRTCCRLALNSGDGTKLVTSPASRRWLLTVAVVAMRVSFPKHLFCVLGSVRAEAQDSHLLVDSNVGHRQKMPMRVSGQSRLESQAFARVP